MSWRDQLRDGKFRGVAFTCMPESRGSGGRRQAVFEYPQREDGDTEDMGRKLRRYACELIVLGPEYMRARDALLSALEAPGPGLLVHPWQGELWVSVDSFDYVETTREGGKVTFSVQFIEKPRVTAPDLTTQPANAVEQAAAAVQERLVAEVAKSFSVAQQGSFVQAAALKAADGWLSRLRSVAGLAGKANMALREMANKIATLVQTPGSLALDLFQLQRSITGSLGLPREALAAQRQMLQAARPRATSSLRVPALTPSHQQERRNAEALSQLIAVAALVEIAGLLERESATALFQSAEEQRELQAEWLAALDEQQAQAAPELGRALTGLKVAYVQAVRAQARVVVGHYRVTTTAPAVVLAYRATGDARDEAELVSRNRLRHPMFVSAGSALELPRHG